MKKLLRIHLFGSPRVSFGEEPVKAFPTEKVKLLFFFLAIFRQSPHARASLWGAFWGESSEAQARHSFSTALWRLQRWLQPFLSEGQTLLLLEDQQVAFNSAGAYWLDTAEFERYITLARQRNAANPELAAAALGQALDLYRGELMEGYYVEWCLAERDRLHQLYLQSLVHLMVYHGARREYREAIAFAQRILQDDPLREDVQRELIKLFALDLQPAEALLQYHRCEDVLRTELGIEPMPETQTLFRHLMQRSIAPLLRPAAEPQGSEGHQLKALLQKLDRALQSFETVRNELAQAIEAL